MSLRLPADPYDLDWWLASDQTDGEAAMSAELPTAPAQLLVAAADGGSLEGLEVTAAYELDGGFGIGLGLIGLSVGLVLFGWITLRRRPDLDDWDHWDDEQHDERRQRRRVSARRPRGRPTDRRRTVTTSSRRRREPAETGDDERPRTSSDDDEARRRREAWRRREARRGREAPRGRAGTARPAGGDAAIRRAYGRRCPSRSR